MEFSMPVNKILLSEVTKLDSTLTPPEFNGDAETLQLMKDSLTKIIDYLGEESAKAQHLKKAITTGAKMCNTLTPILIYLIKDENGNGGEGQVIGYLKVGYKKLFLQDPTNKFHEVEPLCVLDFYVLGNRQRLGFGKKLFDYMIEETGVHPKHIAMDGPSENLVNFMRKNYGVSSLLTQSYNFAVAPEFFAEFDPPSSASGSTSPMPTRCGRYTARKPPSEIADVIHGGPARSRANSSSHNRESVPTSPSPELIAARVPGEPVERPSSLRIESQTLHPTSPGTSRATSPAASRATSPAASLAASPAASRATSPAASRATSPAASSATSPAASRATSPAASPVAAGLVNPRRESQINSQGFRDLKFHHNKLW